MPLRLLIAEDSQQTREQLRELLEGDKSYQVDTVGDGEAVIAALKKNDYSFLLTDLRMPGINGMQLIEQVRQLNNSVTVIVMTGYGSIDQAVAAMRLGVYDF